MKKLIVLSSLLLISISSLNAQALKRGTVTDIDGNVYQTVVIGKYEWMAENLKTTTYNNGTKILYVTKDSAWTSLSNDAYCWYNNNENNVKTYGALYNWYAVNTGNLCPDGWRVPSDEEWKYLEGYVDTQYGVGNPIWNSTGGQGSDASQRLKATSGWKSGGNGTDSFGFSALPGGERLSRGRFFIVGCNGFWWSSSEYNTSYAWYRSIIYSIDNIIRNGHDKRFGFSIRCLRDH